MFRLSTGGCTRVENLDIRIDVDKQQFDRVHDLVKTILGREPPVAQDGDTVNVHYTFAAEYYGKVEERLAAVLALLNTEPSLVMHVDSNMLDSATCLLARVVEKLRLIKTSLTPREA